MDPENMEVRNIADFTVAISNAITGSINGLREELKQERVKGGNLLHIKNAAASVTTSDGLDEVSVREWMKDMTVAGEVTRQVPNNIARLAVKTTTGGLYREIQRWL